MSDEKKVKGGSASVGTAKAAGTQPPAAPAANGVKPPESKRARFVRLINRRMARALKTISHVANLANKSQYEYSQDEAARIVRDLRDRVSALERAFQGQQKQADSWSL